MSISGIPSTSTLLRDPVAIVNRVVQAGRGTKTVKAAVPAHQAVKHHHTPVYYTNSFRSVPLNLFRNNGARFSGNIEHKSFSKIKSATLQITVTVTNAGNASWLPGEGYGHLAPVTHWFDRIEIRSNNGSNHVGILRNDQLAFNLNMIPSDKLVSVLDSANIQPDWAAKGEYNEGDQITFYLPLVGSYLDINQYFANVQGDLVLDFVPAASIVTREGHDLADANSDIVRVDCNSLDLIIETESLTREDEMAHDKYHSQVISSITAIIDST